MLSLLFLSYSAASFTASLAAPLINSTTLRQNAIDAQILNSEFRTLNSTDACDSGQSACVNGSMAVCKFGSWQTSECGNANQCFAVPSTKGPGVNLLCTAEASALTMFDAAGMATGLFANGTDTVAFPTVIPNSAPSASTSSLAIPSQTDDVEIVTVTVTLPPVFSTSLPTEVRTIDPAEAASILSSLSEQGFVASFASPTASPASTPVGHCQTTRSAVLPSAATPIPVASASASTSPYSYHRRRGATRAI